MSCMVQMNGLMIIQTLSMKENEKIIIEFIIMVGGQIEKDFINYIDVRFIGEWREC